MKIALKKLNPIWWFLNDHDKKAPIDFRPGSYGILRELLWLLRNPLHNFTFFIIGISDKPFVIRGLFPSNVFNPNGGWKYHFVIYKKLKLPFISYCNKVQFYIGWRERGNFGISLRRKNG